MAEMAGIWGISDLFREKSTPERPKMSYLVENNLFLAPKSAEKDKKYDKMWTSRVSCRLVMYPPGFRFICQVTLNCFRLCGFLSFEIQSRQPKNSLSLLEERCAYS